jgi:hypothetical protein
MLCALNHGFDLKGNGKNAAGAEWAVDVYIGPHDRAPFAHCAAFEAFVKEHNAETPE